MSSNSSFSVTSLDGHFVGQVMVDDFGDATVNLAKAEIRVGVLAHVYHAHRHHLCLVASGSQHAVAHEVGARVDAEYYLFCFQFFFRLLSVQCYLSK